MQTEQSYKTHIDEAAQVDHTQAKRDDDRIQCLINCAHTKKNVFMRLFDTLFYLRRKQQHAHETVFSIIYSLRCTVALHMQI